MKKTDITVTSITYIRDQMYSLYCLLSYRYFSTSNDAIKNDVQNLFDTTYQNILKELIKPSENPKILYPDFEIKEEDLFGKHLKQKKSVFKTIKKFFKKCG